MIERVLIAGGGTGGHLFPGIAVVEELRRRNPSIEVTFVGTARGIESRVLPKLGERLELIDVMPLKGTTAKGLLASLMKLPKAWGRAVSLLRQHRPDVVIGVGGYASGPMLVAAAMLGIKTALLEQNAHVGLTNRALASIVGRAYLTYPSTRALFGAKARVLGNPVRRAFVDAARLAWIDPDRHATSARRVLVLGGSQGAKRLNELVPEALAGLGDVEVVHQTGAAMQAEVQAKYVSLGSSATATAFIDDVASAFASASVIVARAGATTLAELTTLGRPAILVPFPHAADDHQTENARALESEGAAICLPEHELDAARLRATVEALLTDETRRRAMAEASRRAGRPDAAENIVDDLVAFAAGHIDVPGRGDDGEDEPKREARAGEPEVVRPTPRRAPSVVVEATGEARPSVRPTVDFRAGRELSVRASSRPSAPPVRLERISVPPARLPS